MSGLTWLNVTYTFTYNYSSITSQCVSDDKEKKKEIRERAVLKYQEKLSSESRSKAEKKHAERKYALETMMKVAFSDPTIYPYISQPNVKKLPLEICFEI